MTRLEFLEQLRSALGNDLSGDVVQENVNYYDQYITEEIRNGKSEEQVLQMLGDPWVIARTITDVQDGTDQTVAEEAGSRTHGHSREKEVESKTGFSHLNGGNTWWKKLVLVVVIILVIVTIFSIITGVIRLFAPIVVPVVLLLIFIKLFGKRRS